MTKPTKRKAAQRSKARKPLTPIFPDDPVFALIRQERGLAGKIAKHLGIKSRTAPHMWRQVPACHVVKVGEMLRIARHRIRPDIYPER